MPSRPTRDRRTPVCDDDALRDSGAAEDRAVPLDTPAWTAWLTNPDNGSFAYDGAGGSFTARRELRGGRDYWYAYRKVGGRTRKVYLGRPEDVTRARLVRAAVSLAVMGSTNGAAPPADHVSHGVRVQLLGGFAVEVGGRPVPPAAWRARKPAAVVKLLALAPDHRLTREALMDLLWPELDPAAAANNLRVALHAARRALAPAAIAARGDWLLLDPTAPIETDVAAFEAAVAAIRRDRDPAAARAALDLYASDLLPDDLYEAWASGPRAALRGAYLDLLGELANREEARGERGTAIDALEQLVAADPTREAAQRPLMRLYAETGQRDRAVRQYARLRMTLAEEVGAEPEAATRALHRSIMTGALAPALPPPPPETNRRPGNVPLPLTSFIGRAGDLAQLRAMLGGTRLLTLTGTGGIGKTRLALELARSVQDEFADGVWLVELAALAEPGLMPRAVAEALGVREHPGRPVPEALVAWLRGRAGLLLMLDNCEHLTDACADLAEVLLRSCPGLLVLATSRRPLGADGEVTWRVPPLTVAAEPDGEAIEAGALAIRVGESEAAQLFLARAVAVHPGFAITGDNAAAVAEIGRRLDGIPLALELAAVRMGAMGIEQLAARLDDRFGLLTGSGRTALPRQQTLRATVEWSHSLLTLDQQRLFRRLAVFAGGWTLAGAEAVGAATSAEQAAVSALLAGLVDQSLVQADLGPGGPRYRLLEPVRGDAQERLAVAGEEAPTRDRHFAWCLALAEDAAPHLRSSDQLVWLERLEREHDNLRAALAWSVARDPAVGLRLAARLWPFWQVRGHHAEGRRHLDAALVAAPAAPDAPAALLGTAILAVEQGDRASARARYEAALATGRRLGDARTVAWALRDLGGLLCDLGDYAAARVLLDEGLTAARETGDRRGLAAAHAWSGWLHLLRGELPAAGRDLDVAFEAARLAGDRHLIASILRHRGSLAMVRGDLALARRCYEEGLAVAEEAGARWMAARLLGDLGEVARQSGDAARAVADFEAALALGRAQRAETVVAPALVGLGRALAAGGEPRRAVAALAEGLALARRLGSRSLIGAARHALGIAALEAGDRGRARRRLAGGLTRRWELGEPVGIAEGFEGRARAAGAGRAARWLGAAGALRSMIGAPLPPAERPAVEATAATARAAMGTDAFDAAWTAGAALPPDAAVDEALGAEAEG